jgi:type I restriction enzyme R subunit
MPVEGIRKSREAVAETIENNVRRLIIDETGVNPKYYEKMSELLEALIWQRKQEAIDYKVYLARIVDLTRKTSRPETQASYPASINSPALRALFDNLVVLVPTAREPLDTEPPVDVREAKALALDRAIRRVKKADWRGSKIKEREVRNAIHAELGGNESLVNAIFEIVKAQSEY